MKNKILATVSALGFLLCSAQGELKWITDFEEGKEKAAESGKILFVNFTGSDWCHWCIQLKAEVFSQQEFEAAADNYVLVELDFPQAEDVIAPEQRAKNEELAQGLGIQGFPSVVLFDGEGRAFARTGYQKGGPKLYLEHLSEISKPYSELKSAEGEERKEALLSFLQTLPGMEVVEHFSAELDELQKLDPDDETGFIVKLSTAKALAKFELSIEESLAGGDFDAVLGHVDAFLTEHDPQGESRQHVLMGRVMVYVELGEKEKAFAEIDEMATFAPESEFSQNIENVKSSISEHLEMRAKLAEEAEEGSDKEESSPEELPVVEAPVSPEETKELPVNPALEEE